MFCCMMVFCVYWFMVMNIVCLYLVQKYVILLIFVVWLVWGLVSLLDYLICRTAGSLNTVCKTAFILCLNKHILS